MAYQEQDPMGNYTGYSVDQEAEAIALREEEDRKRKEEEERQRKEAERIAKERDNLAVHKQEVTTYANGSKTITNVAEVPADARAPGRPGPVAPEGFQGQTDEFGGVDQAVERQRQAPVAPVAPSSVFERQIQAESGGQHIDPRTGQIMTSPKGALGVAQIMPATARQPGYGIEPITEEELRTPEGNRAFGERYKQGMLNAFGGDEEKATAAYNAGPGAVQKAIRRAEQQGGDYKDYLPNETKNYLQKVFGGQAQQQAQPAPVARPAPAAVAPVAPGAIPDEVINNQVADFERRQAQQPVAPVAPGRADQYSLATGTGAPGLKVPGMQPTGVATSAPAINAYQTAQNDPLQLMQLGSSDDPTVPAWIKERSRNRAADLVTHEREMNKAKEVVATSSETDLAKYLRKKTEGGSYLKLFMYNMLGMDKSAGEESAKLGMGDEKVIQGADGKPYMVKIGINGTPIEGYNAETGAKLGAGDLIKVAAGASAIKGAHQAGDVYKDPSGVVKGSFVLETRPGQTPVYKEVGTGRIATAAEGAVLNKTGVAGTLENQLASQRQKLMEQLRYVEPTKRMEIAAKFDQENGTNFARQLREEMPDFFGGKAAAPAAAEAAPARAPTAAVAPTALPAGTQGATQAAAGGPVAPGQVPAAAPTTQAGILAERERQKREAEATSQVSVDARKDYNQYVDKELVSKVPNATKISRIRSSQLDGPDGLLAVPEVAGIMAGGGSAGREVGNIIRDMLTGQFSSVEDLNKRVVGLGIQGSNPKVYNALMTQVRLQQELGPLTIKETAPVGAISDSEQKMNTSNQVDVTRNPAYVTFNLLSKNKFQTDLTQAKADFAAKNPELNTIAKFNQAWTKEEGKLYKQYDDIYAARAAYVGEHKNTPLAAAAGYKLFPVPAWNSEKAAFEYKGQPYAKKRPPIDSFVK